VDRFAVIFLLTAPFAPIRTQLTRNGLGKNRRWQDSPKDSGKTPKTERQKHVQSANDQASTFC
jgi:hypothetical protein